MTTLRLPASFADLPVVVVDVEGNGQQPPEIIELAAVALSATRPTTPADLRTWLIRPDRPITGLVTRKVHGISNRDVAESPRWTQVADAISEAIDGAVVVAHNASVERRVLGTHLPGWQPSLVLDTLRLARAVWPDLPGGYGLDHLITHAGITAPACLTHLGRHRAGYDTWMTAALFVALIEHGGLGRDEVVTGARLPEQAGAGDGAVEQGGLW